MVRKRPPLYSALRGFCIGLLQSCVLFLFLHAESEDALLKMSVPLAETATPSLPDFSRMTEDEQIAYALQMSMQGAGGGWSATIFQTRGVYMKM